MAAAENNFAGNGRFGWVRAFRLAFCSPQCHVVFRLCKHHAAAGESLAPGLLDRRVKAGERAVFAGKQRCHLAGRGQTGHGHGVIIPERLAVPGDAGQGVAAAVLLNIQRDAAGHRQGAAVEGHKAALAAFHKGADGLLQFRAGHRALVSPQAVRHDHGSCHLSGVVGLQHTAGKAVCGGEQHIGAVKAAQGVRHDGEGGGAAVFVEHVGIAFLRGQHDLVRSRLLVCKKLGIERLIGLLCRELARDHLGDHILGDGKEIVGGDADVHVVFFHHRAGVLHGIGQAQGDVLAVAQNVLPFRDDPVLCLLGEHDVQHLHGFCAAGRVLLQVTVQRHLEIGSGHDLRFAVLAEEGQEGGVDALILEHLHAGRGAKVHGHFSVPEQVHHVIVHQVQDVCRKVGILNELCHPLEGTRPDGIVQPDPRGVGGVAV